MGGELGTRVAQLLEARSDIDEIAGFDIDPPRRRLRRSRFARIDARDRERVVELVTDFAPTTVAHFGVYEPGSRLGGRDAAEASEACTVHALGAAVRAGALEHIVVRSGLVVYGRGPGRPQVPDELAELAPTNHYGRICLDVEAVAAGIGRRHDIAVCALRYATIVGSHIPSPLGRVLRLPAVPIPALADPPFCLVHQEDAAIAMMEAVVRAHEGPLNVVAPGATSPWQVVRLGGRIPVPVFGPGWKLAARAAELAGAPVPDHTLEILRRGGAGDGAAARKHLGLVDMRPASEICADLYEWATVTPLRTEEAVA
jgi:UDP-glucose 4-epimerase